VGRAEHDVAAVKDHAAAVSFHDLPFAREARVAGGGILAAFDVHVGVQQLKQLAGGGVRVDHDPIDEFQGGQVLSAQLLGDVGSVEAFTHGRVAGQRDHQHIAELAGELEVADVPGMHDVEAAVALDNGLATGTDGAQRLSQMFGLGDLALDRLLLGHEPVPSGGLRGFYRAGARRRSRPGA
jgi:hypothetical protein